LRARNIRVGKVFAFVEKFLPQAVGESVAEAVAEIQPSNMTRAFSVASPSFACNPHLIGGHGLDLDLGASQKQVQLLATSFSGLTFDHDCGLQKGCSRYSPGTGGSEATQQAFGSGLLSQNSHDG
jgi:hypothetical protein